MTATPRARVPREKVASIDLPASAYPVTVEFHKAPPDESPGPVETLVIESPGVTPVPALGWPTWVRVRYADGRVIDQPPPPKDPG
jgi:hypothetical protein